MYLKSDRNYTMFYFVNNQRLLISKTLRVFAEMIDSPQFVRINRTYLLNVDFVAAVLITRRKKVVTLKNGEQLPIARRKAREVAAALQ